LMISCVLCDIMTNTSIKRFDEYRYYIKE